jgi:hypothetical protein
MYIATTVLQCAAFNNVRILHFSTSLFILKHVILAKNQLYTFYNLKNLVYNFVLHIYNFQCTFYPTYTAHCTAHGGYAYRTPVFRAVADTTGGGA